ncbi:MATE family efflux transporter [Aestuariibacter halophilus]|uniref:Multidrug export protein MepA n=1 Tax=Fluctibacter halophilus TaxID=226011 RepID=A0ABS8G7R3_9ALTE|nr:MATE family efflux transporter [Aestuariibacter halophilus]MCC2615271.1 MATE family efflux transporter [Aestuariibacter halophilus]
MASTAVNNPYTGLPLGTVFIRTAMPIILVMLVNGSLNLVDAYFIGAYVGADGLAAVTAMFPLFMLLIALSTWVSSGFASVMARYLGAQNVTAARHTLAQALTLAVLLSTVLIGAFSLWGYSLALAANGGDARLAEMSLSYLWIVILGSPLLFLLSISSDSLRSEGHTGLMALVSLLTATLNGVLNYWLIVTLDMGVAGSAYGTVLAQLLSLLIVAGFRASKRNTYRLPLLSFSTNRQHWQTFLALGAPASLTYVGVALMSAAILYNLQHWQTADLAATVSAYGIITRIMTFVFLPILGLGLAFQSIAGNNVGAGLYQRANQSVTIALLVALVYSLAMQLSLWFSAEHIGRWFVADTQVIAEVGRILPISILALWVFGPLMMISMYFQSIGDAKRASVLSLGKTYLFALPLTFALPRFWGESGIWYAGPSAELLALMLTATLLYRRASQENARLGLFYRLGEYG